MRKCVIGLSELLLHLKKKKKTTSVQFSKSHQLFQEVAPPIPQTTAYIKEVGVGGEPNKVALIV